VVGSASAHRQWRDAVVLHRVDLSLGLPGHHGIEWMALMILGRASSRFRGAGTLTSLGAAFASTLPFLHGANPFTWLFYLLPGPLMDIAFRYLPRFANKRSTPRSGSVDKLWFLILLGGLAHTTKPLGQLTMNLITGWPLGSFRYGVLYPFASHLLRHDRWFARWLDFARHCFGIFAPPTKPEN
jgi:hypothetical protein